MPQWPFWQQECCDKLRFRVLRVHFLGRIRGFLSVWAFRGLGFSESIWGLRIIERRFCRV